LRAVMNRAAVNRLEVVMQLRFAGVRQSGQLRHRGRI
jgi:hypothetical protein